EQHGKSFYSCIVEAARFFQQNSNGRLFGEAKPFTRMKPVNKIDPALLRAPDELEQRSPGMARIGFAPILAMVRVVLGRIEIGVHAARRTELEKRLALRHGPRRAEKSFDDTAALECPGMLH